MIQILSSRSVLLAGTAAALLAAAPAFAQSADAAADEGAANQEIVVTAQKRSQRLQDVPASVAVVDSDTLTQQGAVKFEDYASRVPGLSLSSGRPGLTQVTLRGITTGPAQSAAATSFYVDEAPIGSVNAYTGGSNTTLDLDPAILSQIEVLKGPQGTLYGANSMGGLIKYVTTAPDFTTVSGRISAGVNGVRGGGTGYSVRGSVSVPLVTDSLVIRASAFNRRDAGFIDINGGPAARENVNYADVTGGRVQLAAKLGSNVRISLQAIGQDTKVGGTSVIDVNPTTLAPLYGDLQQRHLSRERGKVSFRLYNGTINVDLGSVELVSSTTYQTAKADTGVDASSGFGVALGGIGVRSVQHTTVARWSQEFRVDANGLAGGLLDTQVGFYYTHENDANRIPKFYTFNTVTGADVAFPNIATASITSKYTEYSVFANATVHFSEQFDVLLGGRYSHDSQVYDHNYAGLIIPGGSNVGHGTEKADVFTFLVTPRLKISDNAMVYLRVSSGYRPGGPNAPGVGAPVTFDPDRLTSYEAGFKVSALDRMLTFDAAVFHTDWKDVQIQTSAGGFNFFVNGGDAVSTGGEATIRLTPTRGLTFGLNAAYTDAHLTEDAAAAGGLKGDRMPLVPRWSGSLTAQYETTLSGDLDLSLGGVISHVSDRISNYTNRAPRTLPAYTTIGLNAGLSYKNYSLTVYAKNLTDERGITALGTLGLTPASSPFAMGIITPRTIGAELAIRF
ncbi:TonB-dependent receptor [Sphingomonas sp. AOB5]|uniref:TonB-dependent receptor n=1 Tax=Sphingomonas sp. AOB5 TaxID=3034017 RepID=UPI0023F9D1EF|nr:TonB-dependent receptor [Sphingomonas sp. AOB5]MDF7773997.1 TonB-dependent receptor [Sphingomonas sp. AOB5]